MRVANASVLPVDAVAGAPSASGRFILTRAPDDGLGRRTGPVSRPGSVFEAELRREDARIGQIPLRTEKLLRGQGMKPESLAWTPREPLEE
ncbi:MAG TPA: hypothetical protein VG457_05270 [Planctomycetota bacterium]|jgi:hypothetical protein|nr:hypothetical protein [Planctomycetota bacterium]